jgi:hypothetical protein
MNLAVMETASHDLESNPKRNVEQLENQGKILAAKLNRIEDLSMPKVLTYLAPLIVSQSICVFRIFRSSGSERIRRTLPRTRLQRAPRRWSAKSVAAFEFRVGSYLFSLNCP